MGKGGSKFAMSHCISHWLIQQLVLPYNLYYRTNRDISRRFSSHYTVSTRCRSNGLYRAAEVSRWNGCHDAGDHQRCQLRRLRRERNTARRERNTGHVDFVAGNQRELHDDLRARRRGGRHRHALVTSDDAVRPRGARPLPGGTRPRPGARRGLQAARVQARLSQQHRESSHAQYEARL